MRPMTRQALWAAYVARNPHWLTGGANLTPDGLRRLFDQTWDVAYRAGQESGEQDVDDGGREGVGFLDELMSKFRKASR